MKSEFQVKEISKTEAASLLEENHYLSKVSKGFRSGFNYGCFRGNELVGVAIFTGFPVPELAEGMLGLDRNQQDGLFELSRFCLEPTVQQNEHNLGTWFLSRSIRALRKATNVRVILSYADSEHHNGVLYAAANFQYYGLTNKKKDFFFRKPDGSFTKHSRGSVRGADGEWRDRSRKHRFAMVFDKNLEVKWAEQTWSNKEAA